jgi:hypothetical protein
LQIETKVLLDSGVLFQIHCPIVLHKIFGHRKVFELKFKLVDVIKSSTPKKQSLLRCLGDLSEHDLSKSIWIFKTILNDEVCEGRLRKQSILTI